MKFIIVSTNQDLIDSIERYLKYLDSVTDVKIFLIRNPEKEAYQTFLIIRNWLERLFENDATEMKHTLAFLDLPVMDCSTVVSSDNSAGGLLAMLYLAFPEIYWVLLMHLEGIDTNECLDKEAFEHFHVLFPEKTLSLEKKELNLTRPIESFVHGYTPLFDLTGFRHLIIKKTLEQLNGTEENGKVSRPFFCERKEKALVIDEELSYSFLHSYVAYKFGHRAMMVTTKKILDRFNTKENGHLKNSRFDLCFEDIYLSFPDNPLKKNESQPHLLADRAKTYNFFKNIPRRIFVTIGERGEVRKENRAYRQGLKYNPDFKFYKMLYKPYAGIFNLKKEARLIMGNSKKSQKMDDTPSGHSQPGRLGMISDILIDRGTRVLAQAKNSNDAVYAAMLGLQAQEILGGRTATESIKAVALKHQAEVTAECMFYGVEHNFDLKCRFEEIHEELRIIGKWFGKSKRDIMVYNSELNIVNELARVFRNYSQFDEEQDCLEKVRHLNRKIYRKRNKFLGWLVNPFRCYVEFLLGKINRFLAAILIWPMVFTILYCIFPPKVNTTFIDALFYSLTSFFALQTPQTFPFSLQYPFISVLANLLGFFHLGIFISHLYTIVSRR